MVFFLGATSSWACEVLHCLGKEELHYHRNKDSGPLYKLNQMILNQMATGHSPCVRREFIGPICHGPPSPPSLAFLKQGLLHREGLLLNSREEGAIKENFAGVVLEIFLDFLSILQAQAPEHGCLDREIPYLREIKAQIHYLRNRVDIKRLIRNKRAIEQIFRSFGRIEQIYQKCRKA